jgi:hypothetical protein
MILAPEQKKSSIIITGDGSCAFYPPAVTLCAALFDKTPLKINKTFLEKFADFHPNFNPKTEENLHIWIQAYAKTKRDMELLVGPVLRYWHESEAKRKSKKTALNQLVTARENHADDNDIAWICDKLGFNFTVSEDELTYSVIDSYKGNPTVHIVHTVEHFDLELAAHLSQHVHNGESFILRRSGNNVDNAWNYQYAPLEQPSQLKPVKREIDKLDSPKALIPAFDLSKKVQPVKKGKHILAKEAEEAKAAEKILIEHLRKSGVNLDRAFNDVYIKKGFDKALELSNNHESFALVMLAKIACRFICNSMKEEDLHIFVRSLREELEIYKAERLQQNPVPSLR